MIERHLSPITKGYIRISEVGHPERVLYEDHNIIVNSSKSLFARWLCSNYDIPASLALSPLYGVWGLCIGAGDPTWSPNSQLVETVTQTALVTPILRKRLTSMQFLDPDTGNPVQAITEVVNLQTILNATTDGIGTTAIREMGLIGGGTPDSVGDGSMVPTDMTTAPFWDPDTSLPDTVTLLNYKTMSSLILPAGISFSIDWVLTL